MATYGVGQSNKNTGQRGEILLLAQLATLLHEPIFLCSIVSACSGKLYILLKPCQAKLAVT